MLKRIILSMASLLLVTGLMAPTPALADEETVVSVKNNPEVTKGSNLVVTVEINQVADLSSFQFDISYNPELLSFESITNGRVGGIALPVRHIDIEDGLYHIRAQVEGTISGGGTLAAITFLVLEEGTTNIAIRNGTLSGQSDPINAVWLGSSITVLPDGKQPVNETPVTDQKDDTNIIIRQPVESQTIIMGTEDESAPEVTSRSVSDGEIKWPIIGGIFGGALLMVILAVLPKSGKEKGYLD